MVTCRLSTGETSSIGVHCLQEGERFAWDDADTPGSRLDPRMRHFAARAAEVWTEVAELRQYLEAERRGADSGDNAHIPSVATVLEKARTS